MKITVTSLIVICLVGVIGGARILAIFPFNAKSHYNVFEPLLKRLSARGHEIVAVTHFPQKIRLANFTDLDISSGFPNQMNTLPFFVGNTWQKIYVFCRTEICDSLGHSEIKSLINAKKHFDLLVIEIFTSDCFLCIAHALNISKIIGAVSTSELPWSNMILKNPENPSYIPNFFGWYSGRMNLLERSINMGLLLISKLAYR